MPFVANSNTNVPSASSPDLAFSMTGRVTVSAFLSSMSAAPT
jgi:hypothetical protein